MNKITHKIEKTNPEDLLKIHKKYLKEDINFKSEEFDELILLFSKTNANDLIRYFFKNCVSGSPSEDVKRELASGFSNMIAIRAKVAEKSMKERILRIREDDQEKASLLLADLFLSQAEQVNNIGGKLNIFYWYFEEQLYHLSLNFSEELLDAFEGATLPKGVNVLNYVKKYLKTPRQVGAMERKMNITLKEVVRDLSDRIIELYQWNNSYNKIQKLLTKECIEIGRIPAKSTRLSRARKSSGSIIEVDTLLPINEIKKVILESQLV